MNFRPRADRVAASAAATPGAPSLVAGALFPPAPPPTCPSAELLLVPLETHAKSSPHSPVAPPARAEASTLPASLAHTCLANRTAPAPTAAASVCDAAVLQKSRRVDITREWREDYWGATDVAEVIANSPVHLHVPPVARAPTSQSHTVPYDIINVLLCISSHADRSDMQDSSHGALAAECRTEHVARSSPSVTGAQNMMSLRAHRIFGGLLAIVYGSGMHLSFMELEHPGGRILNIHCGAAAVPRRLSLPVLHP